MPKLDETNVVAWVLAALGAACGIAAAYVQGGLFAGLTAASAAFTGLSGAWGYTSRPVAKG